LFQTGDYDGDGITDLLWRDTSGNTAIWFMNGARPAVKDMIAFIDDHRAVYGVEPICNVLPIAPSTYHDHVAKRADPSRLSDRAKRDLGLKTEIERVFAENFEVYGARKVWRQLNREGIAVARCSVERLMAGLGLQGRDPRQTNEDDDRGQGGALPA
jgi:HTH-like domain